MSETLRLAHRRVLLIDDDDVMVGSLRQTLAARGCDVDVALDPSGADRLMASKHYDVVVVDPYLTGGIHGAPSRLLDRIDTLQPLAALVIVTGYASAALTRSARSAAVLSKPQAVAALSDSILNTLRSQP